MRDPRKRKSSTTALPAQLRGLRAVAEFVFSVTPIRSIPVLLVSLNKEERINNDLTRLCREGFLRDAVLVPKVA